MRRGGHGPPLAAQAWGRDERGVSDLVGNILLVGITVLTAGVLAGIIFTRPPPQDQTVPDVLVSLNAGPDGMWSTGDENVSVTHRGGEVMRASESKINITGSTPSRTYAGSTLGTAFATGPGLTIGETWYSTSQTFTIAQGTAATISVVLSQGSGSRLVTLAQLTAGAG